MRFCQNCGGGVDDGLQFCTGCGVNLADPSLGSVRANTPVTEVQTTQESLHKNQRGEDYEC